jgi:predicted Na+-dependent transporter
MAEFLLQSLAKLAILIFVICSMLGMGFGLTLEQIIAPLKIRRLVIIALLVNFVLVPVIGFLVILLIPLEEGLAIGLILLATAAGAPFLPKLAEVAKGDLAFSVGLMVVLMVVTIIFMPIVLPLLIPDVTVNPWDIASSLIFLMLIPLAIGLLIRKRYESIASGLRPFMSQASTLSLIAVSVLILVLNYEYIIGVVGTGAILAVLIFVILCIVLGLLGAGKDRERRSVFALGTAQRNIAAALIVGGQNFDNPNVMVMIMVAAIVTFIILFPIAGEYGRRSGNRNK